jgi:AcrR family transcriptional regulator
MCRRCKPFGDSLAATYSYYVADPRIERTRLHVLTVARAMLAEGRGEPPNFSRLAERAQVSRRTLYTHWGTIERVIAEAVALGGPEKNFDPTGLSPRERLRALLNATRDRLTDPITHVALINLVAQAATDSKAGEALAALSMERIDQYNELVGPTTRRQYAQIIGPLFFKSIVLGSEITDEFIEAQVDIGMMLLGLD